MKTKMKMVIFALLIALVAGLAVPAFVSTPASAYTPSRTAITTTPTTTTTTLGPMMVGLKITGNTFVGIALSIKLGGDGSLKLANIRGISLNGAFTLKLVYDVAPTPNGSGYIISGTVTSLGTLPKGTPITGSYADVGKMLNNPNLVGDYFILFDIPFGNSNQQWAGLLIGNLPGTVKMLPQILTAMGGPDITAIMPALNLVVGLINPLIQKHPLIIIMPMDSMLKLMPLMGMGG